MASESLIKQLSQSFYNANGTPNERLDKYCSKEVQKIVIDGNEFTGYKTYSFFWEKTYVKEPTRSSDGNIGNLNSYATFITPHLQIKFSLMSMEDYRRIYGLILSKNEFLVTCYNPITNETTTNRMYFYPDSLPKLNMIARNILNNGQKEKWIELLGVQDYTIEMVGTNVSTEKVEILYYDFNDTLLGSKTVDKNAEFIIGEGILVPSINGYNFEGKWQRLGSTEDSVPNKSAIFAVLSENIKNEELSGTIKYKAQYTNVKEFVLSLSWGIGIPKKDKNGKDITAIKFIPIETLGNALTRNAIELQTGGIMTSLPLSDTPSLVENGKEYPTYINRGWKMNANVNSTSVNNDTKLNLEANMIFYQVFEPVKNSVTFNSNGGTQYNSLSSVEYGSSVPLPIPYKANSIFGGWFTDSELKNKFDGIMPPYEITLYAQWK